MVCTGDGFSVSEESQNMGKGFSKSLRISKSFRISGSYQYVIQCVLPSYVPIFEKKRNVTRIESHIDSKKEWNTH